MPVYHNACVTDQCKVDGDCKNGGICVAPGMLGNAVAYCLRAFCHTDKDCTAAPGGICAPVKLPCCNGTAGLFCVYPSHKGCHKDTDCPSGSYCKPDYKTGEAVCEKGSPICPA